MTTPLLHTPDLIREYPAPAFPARPIPPEHFRNGMIVRMPNWLGDAVMALPALRQLRRILPADCALAAICPAGLRPLFESLPWLDLIFPLADTHRVWTPAERKAVRRFSPGVGVLFNNSLRDALMLRLCRVPELYGAAARCRGVLLRRSFRFPARKNRELNRLHHASRYLAIAEALGAPPWDGTLPEIEIARPWLQLRSEVRDLADHPKLLVLAAGAAYGAAKRWSSENFRAVAADWIAAGGIAVAVGGKGEAPIGEEIADALPPEKFYQWMGRTDLPELMHLLRRARAVVANDSGVMHLAAALGTPGVAIFGSTDFSATGPIGGRWNILYAGENCSPCFRRVCPAGNARCMAAVTPEMVVAALPR